MSPEARIEIAKLVLSEVAYELPEEKRGPALELLEALDQIRIVYAGIEAGTNTRAELAAKVSVLAEHAAQLAGMDLDPRLARALRLANGIVAILATEPESAPEAAGALEPGS